jgi:hypothetical protein
MGRLVDMWFENDQVGRVAASQRVATEGCASDLAEDRNPRPHFEIAPAPLSATQSDWAEPEAVAPQSASTGEHRVEYLKADQWAIVGDGGRVVFAGTLRQVEVRLDCSENAQRRESFARG